jgi:putative DNA primase/helicase
MSARAHLHRFENVKRAGGGWTARCPTHDDAHNSLSIGESDDGRILLHCHANAGCTYDAICRAVGIEQSENRNRPPSRCVVASYDYKDEHGALLFQALRYDPKGFSQRKPDGAGGWEHKLNGVRRVPYRLAELLTADPREQIFVVEGEKDADRLASLGFTATTNAGGAGKWRDEYSEFLRGRSVVIIPDNDDPGRQHAERVEQSLRGIAASVRVLMLPGLPPKGDVSDRLDARHTADELRALSAGSQETSPQKTERLPSSFVCMADVEAETVAWLWHPYIALGKLTILEGDPGLGKSWLTCALASAVSRGKGLPGVEPFKPSGVLMLSAEDGLGDTLRPRLDAVGADVSRVFALNKPLTFDAAGLVALEAEIIERSPLLVVIDPLFAFTGGKVDIHRANECRAISAPLAAIAERHGCALIAVRHLGKSRGGGHALNAGIGSIDFAAAARSVLLVGQDPDDTSKRAIVQTKNNLAPHGEAIGYTLDGGQFYWTGASDLTAGRILAAAEDEEERGSISEAVDFLRVALSDGGRDAKAIETEARQAGVNIATLRRAKARLGVRSHKVGMPGTHYQKWVWELTVAEGAQLPSEGAQENVVEHLRTNDANKDTYDNNLSEGAQLLKFEHLREPVEHLRTDEQLPADVPDETEMREHIAVMVESGALDEESARGFEELAHDPLTRRVFAGRYMAAARDEILEGRAD